MFATKTPPEAVPSASASPPYRVCILSLSLPMFPEEDSPLPLLQIQVLFFPETYIVCLPSKEAGETANSGSVGRNLGSPPHPPFNYSSAVPILLAAPSLFQVSGDHVGWDRQNAHSDCPWTQHTSLPPSKPFYSFLPQMAESVRFLEKSRSSQVPRTAGFLTGQPSYTVVYDRSKQVSNINMLGHGRKGDVAALHDCVLQTLRVASDRWQVLSI